MKRIWILLVLSFTLVGSLHTQQVISSINFEGLKKNQASHLNQMIQCKVGARLEEEKVLSDVQRLKNVAGVGFAEHRLDTIDGALNLTFEIKEVTTMLPIVNFGGIKDNFWYQLGLLDYNFQGRGQYFSAYYQNNQGYHTGQFYFRNPNYRSTQWGYSLNLYRWASEEPLFFPEGRVNYEYFNTGAGLSMIRNFSLNEYIEVGGTFFREKYEKSINQILENAPGPQGVIEPKFLSKIDLVSNHIDYHFFLLEGGRAQLTYQNVFNLRDQSLFNSIAFLGTQYYRFGKIGNLAMRFKLAFSTNNFSPFAPFVADSFVNLRGVGNRIDRGTGQAVFNIEYRQTLFQAYPFGAQFVVFSDIGSWRNPGGELNELIDPEMFKHFIGGGFRIIYQQVFGATFRIDYGIDVYNFNQRGLVIGLGQYF